MLGLQLRPAENEPLYRQLFDQIADRIRTGAFPDGYRLPPTRSLAEGLGTHRNTVVRAYAELEAAGFLTSTVGRGTFVKGARGVAAAARSRSDRGDTTPPPRGLPWGSLVSEIARAEPLSRVSRLQRASASADAINLTRMQPAPELLPVELFRRCVDHVLRTAGVKALGYAPREGFPSLREAIATDLARLGVPAAGADVVVTSGSQQGLDLLARVLLNPGDLVLTYAETYAGALQVFAAAGARIAGVPSDADGPDLDALRRLGMRRPKLVYLMPNHVNPTGACMTARRREEVLAWARDTQCAVIEDDYAADIELEGTPPPVALRAIDADVIHVGTFSKRLIPALRVGYIVAPPALQPHLLALKQTTDLGGSALLQLALTEFLERGWLAAHLNRIQPAYRARRDALLDALERHAASDVRWQRPARGVCVWAELPPGVAPERVFDEGVARHVLIGSGDTYVADESTRPGMRLNFCFEPEERLREGARLFAAAVEAARQRDRAGSTHAEVV